MGDFNAKTAKGKVENIDILIQFGNEKNLKSANTWFQLEKKNTRRKQRVLTKKIL